jgi:trimethylamine--corrinoid protein Co-methyltransferase
MHLIPKTLRLLVQVMPGGSFLMSDLTTKQFRNSQFSSNIWLFLNLDKWTDQGKPTAEKILRDRTCELLDQPIRPEDHAELISKGEAYLDRSK